ncbi:MAG: hypothetical protein KC486_18990, partial [Myxococcales bacterium]|nr:hypothetical protein [Myxococcales bacterium]
MTTTGTVPNPSATSPRRRAPMLAALTAAFIGLFASASAQAAPGTGFQPIDTPAAQPGQTQVQGTSEAPATETICNDGEDNDGDTVMDCADADCASDPACQPDGAVESTEARCSDWVDNDKNGFADCDDTNCDGTRACMGSWDLEQAGASAGASATGSAGATEPSMGTVATTGTQEIILKPGESPEDLLNREGLDAGGERSHLACSDGIDNDGDGLVDCDDIGCRLSTEATVCQPTNNVRFSVVARVGHEMEMPSNVNGNMFNQNTS